MSALASCVLGVVGEFGLRQLAILTHLTWTLDSSWMFRIGDRNLNCMYFPRFVSLILLAFCSASPLQAQTTNILNLCTEGALRAALGIGGNYRVECGSSIVSINLREPLVISRDITLIATNEILLNGQNLTRLIVIQPGVRVTLGGFLFFSGRQTETNLNNGGIDETAGGAIYNNGGVLTLLRGRFQANTVFGITGQPGQDGSGDNGEAGGDAAGGAIYNNGGQVFASNIVFEANNTTAGVGGKGGNGRTGGLGGNGGDGGDGGSAAGSAIYSNGGRVVVFASIFTNNTAVGALAGEAGAASGLLGFPGEAGEAGDAVGAAIAGANADITVFGCAFVTNNIRAANGLDGGPTVGREPGVRGRNGGDAAGGSVYSTGRLWVTNSTFFANVATSGNGGAGGAGGPSGFGNDGGDGGNGGFATGGAIESTGPGFIVNCTFSDNVVTGGLGGAAGAAMGLGENGDPGNKGAEQGGAIYASSAEVAVANSILANSITIIEGNISDRGGNIATDLNPRITSFASFRLTNPFLLPLASNGGPTPTMAITTNSPGIDRGVSAFCPSIDQRGSNRVGNCDIGAFELVLPLPPIPSNIFTTNGLRILDRTNGIVLRWPAGFSNLFLQETTDLRGTNTIWTTVTNAPGLTTSNNFNFLTITPDLARPRAFYRLFGNVPGTNTTSGGGSNFPPFPQLPGLP
jgi:hypothetical protein